MKHVSHGLYAGAVGSTVLNAITYCDMALTGRPASKAPAEVVRRLAEQIGWKQLAQSDDTATIDIQNKRQALGALLGIAVGVGIGGVWGISRPILSMLPLFIQAPCIGVSAMAASDVPLARLGVSDPKTWSSSDWLRDVLPHIGYGVAVALILREFEQRGG